MDFKQQLIAERDALQQRIDAINLVLRPFGVQDLFAKPEESFENSSIFPIKASRQSKLIWIVENHFKKGVRLPELVDAYKKFTGSDSSPENFARTLRAEGKLIFVKYNGRNKLCYWGLPSWVEGNDYKNDFRPDLDDFDIETSEVVGKDEKSAV